MASLRKQYVGYTVGYSEYPPGLLEMIGPTDDARLSKAIDATVKKTGGTKSADTKCTIDGFPGRRITIKNASVPGTRQRGTLNQVVVLARGRMYIAQVIVLNNGSSQQDQADAARFLDSWKLTGQ